MEMINDPREEILIAKLKALDNVHPPHLPDRASLWQSFTERRASSKAKTRKIQWSIAAVFLTLMIGSYQIVVWHLTPSPLVSNQDFMFTESVSEQSTLEYIKRICSENNISCNSPVIAELRADLEVSFEKLREINDQLQLYGEDANLIRAKARIENHQARVIKTIVQTL